MDVAWDSEDDSADEEEHLQETFRWVVTGKTDSGKTHLTKWLLFHNMGREDSLWVFSSTGSASDWPMIPKNQFKTRWDHELVRRIQRSEGRKVIVADDQLGVVEKNDAALVGLFTRGRHHNTSIVLVTQRLNGFSTTIRCNAGRVYVCRTISASELSCLHEEYGGPLGMNRKEFFSYVEANTRDHEVLAIDLGANGSFSTLKPPPTLQEFSTKPSPGLPPPKPTSDRRRLKRDLKPSYRLAHKTRK